MKGFMDVNKLPNLLNSRIVSRFSSEKKTYEGEWKSHLN